MKLVALPAFTDNYIWMLHDGVNAVVVDPGDAAPVMKALSDLQLSLAAILVTHRHADHTGGIAALRSVLQGEVWGPRHEPIEGVDRLVGESDLIELPGLRLQVWDTPGHTAGHVSYIAPPQAGTPWPATLVFCADTLFSGGCGRVFDGTPGQLMHALDRLAALPGDTWLCPAHEYTVANLRFAQAVEPHNAAVRHALQESLAARARHEATLPTTVARERAINPFIRHREPPVIEQALRQGAPDASSLSVFTTLRQWKNHFTA